MTTTRSVRYVVPAIDEIECDDEVARAAGWAMRTHQDAPPSALP